MPAIIGGAIAAGGSLIGGLMGSSAQSKAASQAAAAQQNQLNFTHGIYNTAQQNLNPYINTGTSALYSLASLFGLPGSDGTGNTPNNNGAQSAFTNFTNTPGYQFAMSQGLLGATRGINATGVGGPAAGRALTQYAGGVASQGFNGYISQLANLAGIGEGAANQLGGIGNGQVSAGANLATGIGGAQAAGTIGSTSSMLGGIQNAIGALGAPQTNPSSTAFGSTSAFGQGVSALKGLFNSGPNSNAGGGTQVGDTFYSSPPPAEIS